MRGTQSKIGGHCSGNFVTLVPPVGSSCDKTMRLLYRTAFEPRVGRDGSIRMQDRQVRVAALDKNYCSAGLSPTTNKVELSEGQNPAWLFPAGMAELLESSCNIGGLREFILGNRQRLTMPSLAEPFDARFLSPYSWFPFVFQNFCGLIRHDDETDTIPLQLIRDAVVGWPDQRFVIVTKNCQQIHRVRRFLRKHVPQVVFDWIHRGAIARVHRHNVITTSIYMEEAMSETNYTRPVSFVFFLDPPDVTDSLTRHVMNRTNRARVFGFINDGPRPLQKIDNLQCWFGGGSIRINKSGHSRREVAVGYFEVRKGTKNDHTSTTELLKAGIWHNPKRNSSAARLAKQVAAGDLSWLRKLMPGVDLPNQSPRVAVIAANVSHALALAKLLPDWPIRVQDPIDEMGMSRRACNLLVRHRELRKRKGNGYIVTRAEMDGDVHNRKFDVVLRLDGGVGGLPLEWADAKQTDEQPLPAAVIVDFFDKYPRELQQRSERRIRSYCQPWDYRLPSLLPTPADRWRQLHPRPPKKGGPLELL